MADITQAEFRRGLQAGEVRAFLQPLIDLKEGRVLGFEALARWQHPSRGWLLPSRFLPLTREAELDRLLTARIVGEACMALAGWPGDFFLSVNISPPLICDLSLPDWLAGLAEAAGFPMGRLIVELTETAAVGSYERARAVCDRLRLMGARVAVDDFGTGCANLRHLNELPLDAVKIDASFVRGILGRQQTRDIVGSLVELGRTLGIGVMAEGIEDPRQAEILDALGCRIGQGWLFGRAMSPPDARKAAQRRGWGALPSPSDAGAGHAAAAWPLRPVARA